jgi:hypothetical protein
MILSQYHIFELDTINIYSVNVLKMTRCLASVQSDAWSLVNIILWYGKEMLQPSSVCLIVHIV